MSTPNKLVVNAIELIKYTIAWQPIKIQDSQYTISIITFMITEDFHTWFRIRIECRFEPQFCYTWRK